MVNSSLNLDFSEEIHIHYYCNNYSRSVTLMNVYVIMNNKTNKEELYNGKIDMNIMEKTGWL